MFYAIVTKEGPNLPTHARIRVNLLSARVIYLLLLLPNSDSRDGTNYDVQVDMNFRCNESPYQPVHLQNDSRAFLAYKTDVNVPYGGKQFFAPWNYNIATIGTIFI